MRPFEDDRFATRHAMGDDVQEAADDGSDREKAGDGQSLGHDRDFCDENARPLMHAAYEPPARPRPRRVNHPLVTLVWDRRPDFV
jgi:hypothetical protein